MKKYLRYYFRMFRINLMIEMIYKENFYVWMFVHAISLLTNIFFFKIIYSKITQINGWDFYQTLLVLGVGTLISGIGSLTFFPFMYNFGRDISRGNFDFKLAKPLNPHFQAAFCWVDIEDILVTPISILLIIYSLIHIKPEFVFLNFIGFLFFLLCSFVILFSILTIIESLAFKFVRVDAVSNFYWSIVTASRYPAKSIKNFSLIGIIFLAPIAIISSVPAEVLFGRWEPKWLISSFLLAIISFISSRWVFQNALKHYSSASS